jgi:hypothetical protein
LQLEPELPFLIALGGFVIIAMSTIQFHDQMLGRTEEVYDIGTDRRLTPKMRAVDRHLLERTPQDSLVRRRVRAQLPRGCSVHRR